MNRRQLEQTPAAYSYLRGILAIPGGLVAVVFALGNWRAGPFASDLVVIAALALSACAWYAIDRAYRRRYGRMTQTPAAERRTVLAMALVVGLVFGGSMLLYALELRVNPIMVAFPVAFVALYGIGGALRAHHLAIWGTVLVAGVLPVWEAQPDPSNVALVVCGCAAIASGLLDHLAFTRLFAPPAADA